MMVGFMDPVGTDTQSAQAERKASMSTRNSSVPRYSYHQRAAARGALDFRDMKPPGEHLTGAPPCGSLPDLSGPGGARILRRRRLSDSSLSSLAHPCRCAGAAHSPVRHG